MSNSQAPDPWVAEAEERWGGTEAYEESTRRTASYGPRDTRSIPTDDRQAKAAVDRHRLHISKWFYECTSSAEHASL